MTKYYLTVLFQYLRKRSRSFVLPVISLGLAVAVALIATLDITHERSFDKFQSGFNNIFQLYINATFNGEAFEQNTCSFACGSTLAGSDKGVTAISRIRRSYGKIIIVNNSDTHIKYAETNFCFADTNFFRVFSFPLLVGSRDKVFQNPYSVVITREIAKKYFGNSNPIGKPLLFNGKYVLQVTGIASQTPSNSSIRFDFVCPISTLLQMRQIEKANISDNDISPGEFETFISLRHKSLAPGLETMLKSMSLSNKVSKDTFSFHLVPMSQMHGLQIQDGSVGATYSTATVVISTAILLMAIINYIIFTVAKATARYREIGMRKLLGASVKQIGLQFFFESSLITGFAIAIGFSLFFPLKLFFENVTNSQIDISFALNRSFIGVALTLIASLIVATSIYPALVAAKFSPISIVSDSQSTGVRGLKLTDLFVGLQFFICGSCLIVCLVVYNQINFLQTYSQGIDRKGIVVVPFDLTMGHNFKNVVSELKKLPDINSVCVAHYSMYKEGYDELTFKTAEARQPVSLPVYMVDENFISVLGLKFEQNPVDNSALFKRRALIINQAAVDKLGLESKPIGKHLNMPYDDFPFTVSAVLKDFNYMSLKEKIGALGLFIRPDSASEWGSESNGVLMIKAQANSNLHLMIEHVQAVYNKYDQDSPFSYNFFDDNYKSQYQNEVRLSNTFIFLTVAAIILSCFGLYSFIVLASYASVKPNSIRKLLGASGLQLLISSTKNLIIGFAISVAVICPLCALVLKKWLNNYAFRISLSPSYFILAAGIIFLISAFTISFEIRKILNRSVVEGLKQ